VRSLLDMAARQMRRKVAPAVETESFELIRHYVLQEHLVGFQIGIGVVPDRDVAVRPIAARDLPASRPLLGQMKGRVLPVASARFATQVARALESVAETGMITTSDEL